MESLSPEKQTQLKKLQAENDIEGLKQFVNDEIVCPTQGKPANFGDGSHYSCPAVGGKRRRTKRTRRKRKTTRRGGMRRRRTVKRKKTKKRYTTRRKK